MSNVLRLAFVDPNDATRDALKATLVSLDSVWLEAECSRYEFFSDVVDQTHPDIGFVALDSDPEKGIALVEKLRESSPDCCILVSSSSTDGSLILRAMRAGVKEFLTHPIQIEDLLAALERVGRHKFGGDQRSRSCSTIAVVGATGGVGQTSIAVNLGCALAQDPSNSVALVDLDLSLGDCDVFLDTIPEYSLVDVSQNVSRLDFNLLKRSLTKHSTGLYLLPRPVELEDIGMIRADDLERIMGLLKATFTHLILDCSKSFTACDFVALDTADHVLLVTQLDLPCLRNVVRLMMSFGKREGLKEKTKVVVNRIGLDSGNISMKKAQETIGADVFWQLPNEYRTMAEVRNNGIPLVQHAPRANITQSIQSLANSIAGHSEALEEVGAKSGSGRLFGLWPKRSKAEAE